MANYLIICTVMATPAERMTKTRRRRRLGQAVATITLERVEVRQLADLGYLDPSMAQAEKGRAIDQAVEAFVSDKLAEI